MANKSEAVNELALEVIEKLKNNGPQWEGFIKGAIRYHEILKQAQVAGQQFFDSLSMLAQMASSAKGATGDLGVGMHQIAEAHRQIEAQKESIYNALQNELIIPLQRKMEADKKTVLKIESAYDKNSKILRENIKKAEKEVEKTSKNTKKGKEGQQELAQSLQAVNERVKEFEKMRQDTLRSVLIEERKRYCFLIMHFGSLINSEINVYQNGHENLSKSIGDWLHLAVSPDELPENSEQLVKAEARTYVPIDSASAADFDSVLPTRESTASLGSIGFSSAPPPPPMPGSPAVSTPPSFNTGGSPSPMGGGLQSIHRQSSSSSPIPQPPLRGEPMGSHVPSPPVRGFSDAQSSSAVGPGVANLPPKPQLSFNSSGSPSPMAAPPAPVNVMVASYAYTADSSDKISFREGDEISAEGEEVDGWLFGTVLSTGAQGWFPANYASKKKLPPKPGARTSMLPDSSFSPPPPPPPPQEEAAPAKFQPIKPNVPNTVVRTNSGSPMTMSKPNMGSSAPAPAVKAKIPAAGGATPKVMAPPGLAASMGGKSAGGPPPPPNMGGGGGPPPPPAMGGGGPPPPPPPGMSGGPPPPPPAPAAAKGGKSGSSSSGGSGDRGQLLNSIAKGAKLKKTVTNDRSTSGLAGRVL